MIRANILSAILSIVFFAQAVSAFAPRQGPTNKPSFEKIGQFVAATTAAIATSPLIALAEEVDEYEYGAVNAPIGIAWAGGVILILTSFLPLALKGGEEAFEEMKERDAGKWGSGSSDALDRNRRR